MSGASFSEESLRKIAEQKVTFRFSLKIHLVIFLVINSLLFITNLLLSPSYLWVLYPIFGWQIGLTIHFIAYVMYAKGITPMVKRGVIFNIFAYISVMALLIVADYIDSATIEWSLYPAIFWGAGLILHIFLYFIYFKQDIGKRGTLKSKKEVAIEKEMEKMRKKMNI